MTQVNLNVEPLVLIKEVQNIYGNTTINVTRLGKLLDFGQLFKALGFN